MVAPIVRIRLRSLKGDRELLALPLLLRAWALTLLLWRGRRDRKGLGGANDVDDEIDVVDEETRNDDDNGSRGEKLLLLLLAAAVPAPRRGRIR